MKEVIAKKTLRPAERREVVTYLVMVRGLQVQQTCRAVGLGRATYYGPLMDWARSDASVMIALTNLVVAKGRWGFWQCCDRLQLDGHPWNHKRLWRVYCQLRMNLPRRTKKRLPIRRRQPLVVVPQPNAVWAVDFMSDTLYGGRRFGTLNILDEGVREGLAIEVDTSFQPNEWCACGPGGASRRRFASTLARNFSQSASSPGVQKRGSSCLIFN